MLCALAALALLSAPAAPGRAPVLPAGRWELEQSHSSVIAEALHLGVSYYVMRFDRMQASFTWNPADPAATKLQASVDVTSLDTGDAFGPRAADDFLAAQKYPEARFVSTKVEEAPDGRTGTVTGDLTLMGVTRPVTFDVTFVGVGPGLLFGTVAGFSATTVIHRSDFGSRHFLSFVGDDVRLQIEGEFKRK